LLEERPHSNDPMNIAEITTTGKAKNGMLPEELNDIKLDM